MAYRSSDVRRAYRRAHPEKFEKERQRAREYAAAKRASDPKWQRRQSIYEELVDMQGGETCLICGASPEGNRRLFIDHDHDTDEIRGLLCPRCNRLLGNAADSIERLQSSIDYLSRPRFTGRRYSDYVVSSSWFGQKIKEDAA